MKATNMFKCSTQTQCTVRIFASIVKASTEEWKTETITKKLSKKVKLTKGRKK